VAAKTSHGLGSQLLRKDAFSSVSTTSVTIWRRAWLRVVCRLLRMSVGAVCSDELGWCNHGGFLVA